MKKQTCIIQAIAAIMAIATLTNCSVNTTEQNTQTAAAQATTAATAETTAAEVIPAEEEKSIEGEVFYKLTPKYIRKPYIPTDDSVKEYVFEEIDTETGKGKFTGKAVMGGGEYINNGDYVYFSAEDSGMPQTFAAEIYKDRFMYIITGTSFIPYAKNNLNIFLPDARFAYETVGSKPSGAVFDMVLYGDHVRYDFHHWGEVDIKRFGDGTDGEEIELTGWRFSYVRDGDFVYLDKQLEGGDFWGESVFLLTDEGMATWLYVKGE
ncbi:MAG: hypothetical protein LBL87_08080 [Ruminococcus sp.]|jgi:hypothetical protein|nr:hypothetical protein [Ruminococcus sp.]